MVPSRPAALVARYRGLHVCGMAAIRKHLALHERRGAAFGPAEVLRSGVLEVGPNALTGYGVSRRLSARSLAEEERRRASMLAIGHVDRTNVSTVHAPASTLHAQRAVEQRGRVGWRLLVRHTVGITSPYVPATACNV
jgi:hypothetical protein